MSNACQGSTNVRSGSLEQDRDLTGKPNPIDHQTRKKTQRFQKPKLNRGLTVYLFFPAITGVVLLFAGLSANVIPWWFNLIAALPLYWYCYVTAHDAVHRAAHKNSYLNDWVGWISSGLFGLPFSLIRAAHLSHHRNAGKQDDIERFAYLPGWQLPLGVMLGNWFFYVHFPKCNSKEKLSIVVMAILVVALILCFPMLMLLGWILPMQLIVGFGMFTNIYLPHGPFANWVEKHIPFMTGFHEDHHAIPSYPWHQLCRRETRFACHQKRIYLTEQSKNKK